MFNQHRRTKFNGMMNMDEVDKRIIKVLESDARTSLRSIAEQVGVALGTVSNRVRTVSYTHLRAHET